MVVPTTMLDSIKKIQDTILICAPVISQFAAMGAIRAGAEFYRDKISRIAQIRELVLAELRKAKEVCTVPNADGAFYFLIQLKTALSPMEVTERLIREHGVAVIPGNAFGIETGCLLRLAYGALDQQTAAEAMARFVRGVKQICGTDK
jgi:aspartate/methionine/tyrosine aminotransferase